jgi:hypothetical protein
MLFVTLTSKGQSIDLFQGGGNYGGNGLYWLSTILFSAINTSNNTFNIIKLRNPDRPDKYKSNAIFSIISGSLQTALGVANVTSKEKNAFIPTSINIGLGVTTIVTSAMRLALKILESILFKVVFMKALNITS